MIPEMHYLLRLDLTVPLYYDWFALSTFRRKQLAHHAYHLALFLVGRH